ncbi:hypothetical protein RMATCC62417_12315 [Rhizopus microsporus]|nr:hypothetical protein RMATCC62417_12315 [Rhizopus microsporus]
MPSENYATSDTSSDKFSKVEQTAIDRLEEDRASSINEFGHGSGNFMTAYFNVVCVVAGTGTLGLPKAFAEGGWLGILILILAYVMSVYSGIVLIRCLYHQPGKRLHDYKAIGTAAFGVVGYIIASVLHLLNLFGCPALYLVLASGNMVEMLKGTSAAYIHYRTWVIIWGVFLLIPSLIMKTLKEVTAIAAIGAVCTMMAVFVVVIQGPMYRNEHPDELVIHDSVIWTGFPIALSTIAFSFGGNNTYPHVEHALKKPHQWKERLNNNVHLITQPIRKKSLNSPPTMVEPLATPTVLPPSEQPQQQQQQRHQFQQHQPQQQQQQQQNNTTHHIQSIEERLSAIENILRTLLGSGRHKHLLQNLDHNNAPLPPPQPSPRYPSLYPNPPMLDQQQYSDVLSCRDIYHPPVHVSYIQNGSLSREKRKRDDQDIVQLHLEHRQYETC